MAAFGEVGSGVAALAVVALAVTQLLKSKPLNITVLGHHAGDESPGVEFQPAISPDGKKVAYVAARSGSRTWSSAAP